jgi:hypothetical protein
MAEFQSGPVVAGNMDPGVFVRLIPGYREGIAGHSGYANCRQWLHRFSFALDPGSHLYLLTTANGICAAAMDISPADASMVSLAGSLSFEMASVGLAVLYFRRDLEKAAATQKENQTTTDSQYSNGIGGKTHSQTNERSLAPGYCTSPSDAHKLKLKILDVALLRQFSISDYKKAIDYYEKALANLLEVYGEQQHRRCPG